MSFPCLLLLVFLLSWEPTASLSFVAETEIKPESLLRDKYFDFLPQLASRLRAPGGKTHSWHPASQWEPHGCWGETKAAAVATLVQEEKRTETQIDVSLTVSNRTRGFLETPLGDLYLLATPFSWRVLPTPEAGLHRVHWGVFSEDSEELAYIKERGLAVFFVPEGLFGSLGALIDTLEMLFGLNSEADMLQFFRDHMNLTLEKRTSGVTPLDESNFQSGDQLVILKLKPDGVFIMYAAGSRNDHTATFLRIDGELLVVESCESSCVNASRVGIQRTPWKTWKRRATEMGYSVLWLPLAPEYRARFDDKRAYDWFKTVEGMPYGFHNFFFGWLDVFGSPDSSNTNFPPPLEESVAVAFLPVVAEVVPDLISKYLGQGLNLRLNSSGFSIPELYDRAFKRNESIGELLAVPEQDAWRYRDSQGQSVVSLVCDSFWFALLQHAGAVEVGPIQATEFTPTDAYRVAMFDRTAPPAACQLHDPDAPYCQLFGPWKLRLGVRFPFQVFCDFYSA
jgi:hypothetical protein